MSKYVKPWIRFCKAQLALPYVFGARGPKAFDCIGMMYAAARALGLGPDVFPNSWTVRNLWGWANRLGYLLLVADGEAGERGDLFLYGPAAGGRPIRGAGHVGYVLQPVSAKYPKGKAISAYNPKQGIIIHDLVPPAGGHLALYGFIRLPYPDLQAAPVIEDSAPTEPAVVQPDDEPVEEPTTEELQAKIDAALMALA